MHVLAWDVNGNEGKNFEIIAYQLLKGCSQQMASCFDLKVLKSDDMPH